MQHFIQSLLLSLLFSVASVAAQTDDDIVFDDEPLSEAIILPDWFKVSFMELEEDLNESVENGKRGLIIYFGQKNCPYCKAQLERNWGQADILKYTQANFDVIAIDVLGQRQVTDFDGTVFNEKQFAIKHDTNFTPSLMFYNSKGQLALTLRGYRPPYQFRAALEYVTDQHYLKEPFSLYLSRAEAAFSYGKETLNSHDRFLPPPYALDRSRIVAKQPLLVSFERKKCHACDVLHAGPLQDERIDAMLKQLDVIQLDMNADVPVITPAGKRTTARQWAQDLQLDYAPTLIFFNEHGKEVVRIDSVVWFYRLRNVLNYVISKGYLEHPTFQDWRQRNRR